jgi:hypothetical protein
VDTITLGILLGESCYNCNSYACRFIYLAQGPPTVASTSIWHRFLGHPGVNVLSRLSNDSSVHCSRCTHGFCHACQLDHHTPMPFVCSSSHPGNNFDLTHCDLWNTPIVNVFGYKYYLVILDDSSHLVWTFPLWLKSDTFTTLSKISPCLFT